jgi:hypothetical protein
VVTLGIRLSTPALFILMYKTAQSATSGTECLVFQATRFLPFPHAFMVTYGILPLVPASLKGLPAVSKVIIGTVRHVSTTGALLRSNPASLVVIGMGRLVHRSLFQHPPLLAILAATGTHLQLLVFLKLRQIMSQARAPANKVIIGTE